MESVGNIGRASPGRRHADMDASFLNKVRRIRKKTGLRTSLYGIYSAEEKYGNKVFTMQKRNMAFTM